MAFILSIPALSAQPSNGRAPDLGIFGELGQSARVTLFSRPSLKAVQYNAYVRAGLTFSQAAGRFFVFPSLAFHYTPAPRASEGTVLSVRGDTMLDAGLGVHFRLAGGEKTPAAPMWLGVSFHGNFGKFLNSKVLFFSPGAAVRFRFAPFPGKLDPRNTREPLHWSGRLRSGIFLRGDIRGDDSLLITGGASAGFSW
ncbi:hypothetical protein L21SP2_0909 [Salinispira pacifica]|uniref:Uncharacterized protein n=2 Tax=Salinispira pacifica TaxID=1307761 RepID=V5WFJ0_9SPIO|nr:hypothetical protein L21SP2_0909 [Salinispira pacifica]